MWSETFRHCQRPIASLVPPEHFKHGRYDELVAKPVAVEHSALAVLLSYVIGPRARFPIAKNAANLFLLISLI